jgi:integrase
MRRTDILTPAAIRNSKPAKGKFVTRLLDGDGLYLQVTQSVEGYNRNWIFRYEVDGVRHDYGIGPLHRVSLAEARQAKHDLREAIRQGSDPLQEKREAKKQRLAEIAKQVKVKTFAACAQEFYELHRDGWKSDVYRKQWIGNMERLVYPGIGRLNVADIDHAHVEEVLRDIWKEIPETARRVQAQIARVMDWATAGKLRSGENPAARKFVTARLGKVKNGNGHHAALPIDDLPQFMADLRAKSSPSAHALEFTVLTAARTGEVIEATWDEIDLKKRLWTIPAERMKSGREHRVPLCDRAVEILSGMKRHGAHLFASASKKLLSNMAMLELLRGLSPGHTVHGFRSTFRDWAAERTNYPEFIYEMALAHAVGDDVMKAYRRTDPFEKRVRLMKQWGDFAQSTPRPKTGEVHDLKAERDKRAS